MRTWQLLPNRTAVLVKVEDSMNRQIITGAGMSTDHFSCVSNYGSDVRVPRGLVLWPNWRPMPGSSLREFSFIIIGVKSSSGRRGGGNITRFDVEALIVTRQFSHHCDSRTRSEEISATNLWSSRVLRVQPYTMASS